MKKLSKFLLLFIICCVSAKAIASDSSAKALADSVAKSVQEQDIQGTQSQQANDPFFLPPEDMARIGTMTLKKAMEPFLSRDGNSLKPVDPTSFDEILKDEVPLDGDQDYQKILADFSPAFSAIQREDHPGFVGYTQGYATFISCMGELLKASFNPILPVEWTAPGFNAIQRLVVKWLCQIVGYDSKNMGGHCVSGGTEANELCLAAAVAKFESKQRDAFKSRSETYNRLKARANAVIYVSRSSHQCIMAAANALGFDVAIQVVFIPTLGPKDHFQMDPAALKAQIAADRKAGRVPIFLSACAGSTMTAAYDDFEKLSKICQEHDIWLHGDGAWGGASLLVSAGKECLKGVEHSDSFVIDPHKGLYESYGLGVALLRDQKWLQAFFSPTSFNHPDLAVTSNHSGHVKSASAREPHDMKDYGRQLTQPCKVFGLYMALKFYGLNTYKKAVQLGWNQAAMLAKLAKEKPKMWKVLIEPRFEMVTIQYVQGLKDGAAINKLNEDLVKKVCHGGKLFPNTNYFVDDAGNKRTGIRLVLMNPTRDGHLAEMLEIMEKAAEEIKAAGVSS
jgi:glutamate/tyrosine decarboxylase-like PLP-dependent enzyme